MADGIKGAAHGFDRNADAYEAARPSYPAEAVAHIVGHGRIGPGRRVLDLAAGTGKLTRLLVPTGATVVAVEPVAAMREQLRALLPDVEVHDGTAEALPLGDRSADAITVAQAFHWFDADRAFDEFARVLQLGGRVGLIWNARDRSSDWVNEVWSIMDRVEKRAPWRDHEHWRDSALGARSAFGPLHAETFRHEQSISPEGVVDRIASVSHVAVLPPAERERVLDEVRGVLTHHPDTRSRSDLRIPYRVDAYWCERA